MTSAVPLLRSERAPSQAARSITILGATGSIGTSTIDLIRRNRGRFRVEAVTAARNAGALGKLARDLNASFAAISDPASYGPLEAALSGEPALLILDNLEHLLPEGAAVFGGTFAAKGGIRPAERFDYEISDPVLNRAIRYGYAVKTLAVVG